LRPKLNPKFTLKRSQEVVGETSPRMKEVVLKKEEERTRTPGMGWSCQATRCARALRHGRAAWHGLAVPHLCPAVLIILRVHGCAPLLHARALPCFPLICYSWCLGLPRSSNLPWNRSWSLLFYRNLMISPEMKNECILGTLRSKGR